MKTQVKTTKELIKELRATMSTQEMSPSNERSYRLGLMHGVEIVLGYQPKVRKALKKLLIGATLALIGCGGSVDSTEVTSTLDPIPCDAGANTPDGAVLDPCANPPCEDGGNGTVEYNGVHLQCMCPKVR